MQHTATGHQIRNIGTDPCWGSYLGDGGFCTNIIRTAPGFIYYVPINMRPLACCPDSYWGRCSFIPIVADKTRQVPGVAVKYVMNESLLIQHMTHNKKQGPGIAVTGIMSLYSYKYN